MRVGSCSWSTCNTSARARTRTAPRPADLLRNQLVAQIHVRFAAVSRLLRASAEVRGVCVLDCGRCGDSAFCE
eukprot:4648430-Prymnesium_polylepis.1